MSAYGVDRYETNAGRLLLEGCTDREIGSRLKIAARTVKKYNHLLYVKFGITTGIKRVKLITALYWKHPELR